MWPARRRCTWRRTRPRRRPRCAARSCAQHPPGAWPPRRCCLARPTCSCAWAGRRGWRRARPAAAAGGPSASSSARVSHLDACGSVLMHAVRRSPTARRARLLAARQRAGPRARARRVLPYDDTQALPPGRQTILCGASTRRLLGEGGNCFADSVLGLQLLGTDDLTPGVVRPPKLCVNTIRQWINGSALAVERGLLPSRTEHGQVGTPHQGTLPGLRVCSRAINGNRTHLIPGWHRCSTTP